MIKPIPDANWLKDDIAPLTDAQILSEAARVLRNAGGYSERLADEMQRRFQGGK